MRRRMVLLGFFAALSWLAATAPARAQFKDPLFDVERLAATPLSAQTLKTTEKDGMVTEEVMFHSEVHQGQSVDIFAFLVYPAGGRDLPAFIWNQGGLAQADTNLITHYGAKRGYAAMCIDFPQAGYRSSGGYHINSGYELADDAFDAPISRGVVALIKAVSYLQSRPEVDPQRIGMAGSSWGGFYTTLAVAVDPRLKAGASMFGAGSMHLGNSWWGDPASGNRDAAFRQRWSQTLDATFRLRHRDTPVAWFTGTNDFAYWMPAVMDTYRAAVGPKHLTLLPNFNHGLTPTIDEQVFAWLDVHLRGAPPFVQVTPLKVEKRGEKLVATWGVSDPGGRKPASANVILSYGETGPWPSRAWKTLPAKLQGETAIVELPRGPMPYYVSGAVTDEKGFITSTPLELVDPARLGASDAGGAQFGIDGAAHWGGFEEQDIWFLRAHSWVADAKAAVGGRSGAQALALKPGRNGGLHLHFVAGVPHRLIAWLKADQPAEVTVQVVGSGGQPSSEARSISVGTRWMQVALEVTPANVNSGGMVLEVTVPPEVSVLLDDVSFRPIEP